MFTQCLFHSIPFSSLYFCIKHINRLLHIVPRVSVYCLDFFCKICPGFLKNFIKTSPREPLRPGHPTRLLDNPWSGGQGVVASPGYPPTYYYHRRGPMRSVKVVVDFIPFDRHLCYLRFRRNDGGGPQCCWCGPLASILLIFFIDMTMLLMEISTQVVMSNNIRWIFSMEDFLSLELFRRFKRHSCFLIYTQ